MVQKLSLYQLSYRGLESVIKNFSKKPQTSDQHWSTCLSCVSLNLFLAKLRNISMVSSRHGCAMISSHEVLIVGGDVSGWILDISTGTVRMTDASPKFSRKFGRIRKVGGRIFVVGGNAITDKVEEFRIETSDFVTSSVSLIHPRSRFGSVAVPKFLFRNFGCN